MSNLEARLASFKNWPTELEMKPEELSLKDIQAVCSYCICFLVVVLLWLLILNIAVIAFSFAALPN